MEPHQEPADVLAQWADAQDKMHRAQALQAEAASQSRTVVQTLKDDGHTLREIAAMLNISYQRVAQLNQRMERA